MLGNDVKYKRKKYGARGAQIDLAHGRCSHHPQKSQVPIGTFLGITRVTNFYHFP